VHWPVRRRLALTSSVDGLLASYAHESENRGNLFLFAFHHLVKARHVFLQSSPPARDTMKTLVTGISGYVGAHVALALLKGNKHQVVGVVRDKAQQARLEKEDSFRFYVENGTLTFCIVADLCSESDALSSAMQGVECVHHLASPYHYTGKDAEQEYLRPAIDATMTVIKAATRASPPVSTFALLSSFAAVLSPGDAQYSGKVYTEEVSSQQQHHPSLLTDFFAAGLELHLV
jgi:nucleoside-diphosphate-sugar epimerase